MDGASIPSSPFTVLLGPLVARGVLQHGLVGEGRIFHHEVCEVAQLYTRHLALRFAKRREI